MSTIRVDNFGPSAGGTAYSARGIAKAWVNFNGTGTVAIRDSENVTSITDNGTGNYSPNFTNAMSSVNYAPMFSGYGGSARNTTTVRIGSSTSQVLNIFTDSLNVFVDAPNCYATAHGDLA